MSVCDQTGLDFSIYQDWQPEQEHRAILVADVNAELSHLIRFRPRRAFHVIRDPRDLAVSAYFSHKISHPEDEWLEAQRKLLNQVNIEEGMQASIDFRSKQFRRMAEWNYANPDIYEVRFERLIEEPLAQFSRIFEFMSLLPDRLSPAALQRTIEYLDFRRMSDGRKKGVEKVDHHYRSGTPGDWRRYFSESNKRYFKQMYGELLISLGYESDLEW